MQGFYYGDIRSTLEHSDREIPERHVQYIKVQSSDATSHHTVGVFFEPSTSALTYIHAPCHRARGMCRYLGRSDHDVCTEHSSTSATTSVVEAVCLN